MPGFVELEFEDSNFYRKYFYFHLEVKRHSSSGNMRLTCELADDWLMNHSQQLGCVRHYQHNVWYSNYFYQGIKQLHMHPNNETVIALRGLIQRLLFIMLLISILWISISNASCTLHHNTKLS